MISVYDDDFLGNPQTLCDWVKNFRTKKIQMKRKLRTNRNGGNGLRICAILSTALLNAEQELRRKQQERFTRWLEIQSKSDAKRKNEKDDDNDGGDDEEDDDVDIDVDDDVNQQQYNITKSLNIDDDINTNSSLVYNRNNAIVISENDYVNSCQQMEAEETKRQEEITSLWKYELSDLDRFMRNISGTGVSNNNKTNQHINSNNSHMNNTIPNSCSSSLSNDEKNSNNNFSKSAIMVNS